MKCCYVVLPILLSVLCYNTLVVADFVYIGGSVNLYSIGSYKSESVSVMAETHIGGTVAAYGYGTVEFMILDHYEFNNFTGEEEPTYYKKIVFEQDDGVLYWNFTIDQYDDWYFVYWKIAGNNYPTNVTYEIWNWEPPINTTTTTVSNYTTTSSSYTSWVNTTDSTSPITYNTITEVFPSAYVAVSVLLAGVIIAIALFKTDKPEFEV